MSDLDTRRYAHEIAPAPDGLKYFQDDLDPAGLPKQLAAYHAARAYGFWLGSSEGQWIDGMASMLAEYSQALIWWYLTTPGNHDPASLARELVTDLASPHVIGPNILTFLEAAGIDPVSIRAYGPERTGSPS